MPGRPARGAATIPDRDPLRVLRSVRSVREFRPEPVPDELLGEILEVARWTGSGMNRQPWTFVVVRDRATLAAIADASPNAGHVRGAAAAIVIVMAGGMPGMETFDQGRAAERILAAATALGLASAIGWIMPAGRPAVAARLGGPEGRRVRTLVSLGYPTDAGARPKAARARRGGPSRRSSATSGSADGPTRDVPTVKGAGAGGRAMTRPTRLFRGYVFDLEGTVHLGDALLPTARRTITRLRALGCRTVFLSNNPTNTPEAYVESGA